jgi:hypothetical protein
MQPKVKDVAPVKVVNTDNAIPLKKIEVHQPFNVPGLVGAESKTILPSKYPGLKMWWAPVGIVLERNGNRCLVPQTNIIVAVIDE